MKLNKICRRITEAVFFEILILSLIIINAIVVGVETSPGIVEKFGHYFEWFHRFILIVFILEAFLKIMAELPRIDRYFRQVWNLFDFSIIILSFFPASGQFAMAARLVRVLRIVRIFSVVPELRLIIATLLRTLPSMSYIVILLGVLFYIYGIMGYYLFRETDLARWGTFGSSLLTLFGIVTLETWVDVMSAVLPAHPFAWIFFVSFIIVGTFMFINLFVAVVINNFVEAKKERLSEMDLPVTKQELLKELRDTKDALVRLENRLADKKAE
jgi:voltage-gated sodium channel